MPLKKRALSWVTSLLQGGDMGRIQAIDVGDALATAQPDVGEIYISSSSATTVTDTTSYFDAAGTWTLSSGSVNWDMNTNGQLRYTGEPDRLAIVTTTFSVTAASNNVTLYFGTSLNGSDLTAADVHRKISTGADVGAGAIHAMTPVSTNDYLTLDVRNTTSATNVTFETADIFVMSIAV